MQNMNKHWMCTCTNHTHIGVVTSYQATVILPLISVQIKARSMAAELCWLITGSCKGFRSLSMASGPHPHSRVPVNRATEDLTGMEMKSTIINTPLAYVQRDGFALALPNFIASLQRRHLRASDWCFVMYTSKAHHLFFIHVFYGAFQPAWSPLMASLPSALLILTEHRYDDMGWQKVILCFEAIHLQVCNWFDKLWPFFKKYFIK